MEQFCHRRFLAVVSTTFNFPPRIPTVSSDPRALAAGSCHKRLPQTRVSARRRHGRISRFQFFDVTIHLTAYRLGADRSAARRLAQHAVYLHRCREIVLIAALPPFILSASRLTVTLCTNRTMHPFDMHVIHMSHILGTGILHISSYPDLRMRQCEGDTLVTAYARFKMFAYASSPFKDYCAAAQNVGIRVFEFPFDLFHRFRLHADRFIESRGIAKDAGNLQVVTHHKRAKGASILVHKGFETVGHASLARQARRPAI